MRIRFIYSFIFNYLLVGQSTTIILLLNVLQCHDIIIILIIITIIMVLKIIVYAKYDVLTDLVTFTHTVIL